ncbi:MAG: hypothetical protein R6V47_04315 [Candidatus Delongbacteria bacterium]
MTESSEEKKDEYLKGKPIKITKKQDDLLRKIAHAIASKSMTAPTIFFLETVQPLNFIASQFMAYVEPFLTFVIPRKAYNDVQHLLEQRKGIDYFLTILEDEEYEKQQHDKVIREDMKRIKKMKKIAMREKKDQIKRKKEQKDK